MLCRDGGNVTDFILFHVEVGTTTHFGCVSECLGRWGYRGFPVSVWRDDASDHR
jgi:hypothetical protein